VSEQPDLICAEWRHLAEALAAERAELVVWLTSERDRLCTHSDDRRDRGDALDRVLDWLAERECR
jgi:hypothetical protein